MAYAVIGCTKGAHEDEVWACKWACSASTGTDFMVTGSLDSTIKLWKLNENSQMEETKKLLGHRMGVLRLDISSQHDLIASSGMEGQVRLWDLHTGEPRLAPIEGGKVECWGLAFRPHSSLIGTSAQQGKIRLFDITSGEQTETFETRAKFIMSVQFSANGKYLAAGSSEGMVYIFDLQASRILHAIEAHGRAIRAVVFSPDSKLLATASEDGTVKTFDPAGGVAVSTFTGHSSWVTAIDFDFSSGRIASSSTDGSVRVWKTDRENLATFKEAHDKKIVWDVAFSPTDGGKLISAGADSNVVLYRTPRESAR